MSSATCNIIAYLLAPVLSPVIYSRRKLMLITHGTQSVESFDDEYYFSEQVEQLINMQVLQGLDLVLSDCLQVLSL